MDADEELFEDFHQITTSQNCGWMVSGDKLYVVGENTELKYSESVC